MQYSAYKAVDSAGTPSVWSHNTTSTAGSFQENTSVHFLSNASHFCAYVAYKEEANGGGGHDHLSYPESHVPAMLFGNGAEWKPRRKSPHCNEKVIRLVIRMLSALEYYSE